MRDFDELLDGALAEYSQAEAPLGLEARVIRRLEKPGRAVQWWWGLVPALGVAAAAVVFLLPPPVLEVPLPHGRGSDPIPAVAFQVTAHKPPAPKIFKRWPRVEAEERAFVRLAMEHPEIALQLTKPPVEETAIKPLAIEPLAIAGLDEKGDL
jgi:hypothetical protein